MTREHLEPRRALSRVWRVILVLALLGASSQARAQRTLDLQRGRAQSMLRVVSGEVGESFFDPSMRGLDWRGLTQQAKQQIEAAQSSNEMFLALFRLVNQLQDSHTVFVPPRRAVQYAFGFEAKAFGEEVRIFELSPKGMAAAAGLQLGDRLLRMNGFTVDRRSFQQMMLFFRLVQPVTAMEIVFSRDDGDPERVLLEGREKREAVVSDLTRIDTLYQLLRDAESAREEFHYRSYEGGIGYLHLPTFSGDKQFLRNLAKKVREAGVFIIDLRGNPGGSIESLGAFMGFFDPQSTKVADLVGRDETTSLEIDPQKPKLTGRMVVLVDASSASASEIFAYHFQQAGSATVIGDQTSGRVTAALLHQFSVGVDVVVPYGLQVATDRVVFPDGVELEGRGVIPDHACLPTVEDLRRGTDPCLKAALSLARTRSEITLPTVP